MATTSELRKEAAKRAALGAEYLDKKLPGWEWQINTRTLDLGDGCSCVLGQLATDIVPRLTWGEKVRKLGRRALPNYFDSVKKLRMSHKKQTTHGFLSARFSETDVTYVDSEFLTVAWRKEIKARKKKIMEGF